MATLIVIDMQNYFKAARRPRVIAGCLKQIKLAMRRKAGIVLCEYKGCGQTLQDIRLAIRNYPKATFITKTVDDGSQWVLEECRWRDYDTSRIRACGVNFIACVARTVWGLSQKLPRSKIEIPVAACGDVTSRIATRKFPNATNIFLT